MTAILTHALWSEAAGPNVPMTAPGSSTPAGGAAVQWPASIGHLTLFFTILLNAVGPERGRQLVRGGPSRRLPGAPPPIRRGVGTAVPDQGTTYDPDSGKVATVSNGTAFEAAAISGAART
ncbi:hypothetical protein ACIHCX_34090 [Streptomyces sp. NPDC052043]|uniref:hypothetical protein n=1 Tax=Streptomyces sp. NPDC052043 TaxID=3365684 RepID=UPI0037D7F421